MPKCPAIVSIRLWRSYRVLRVRVEELSPPQGNLLMATGGSGPVTPTEHHPLAFSPGCELLPEPRV